jgi:hypothetical protein
MQWLTSKFTEAESTIKNVTSIITKTISEELQFDADGKRVIDTNNDEEDSDDDRELTEEETVGITPQLKEFVQNICKHPKTFLDFPLDELYKHESTQGDRKGEVEEGHSNTTEKGSMDTNNQTESTPNKQTKRRNLEGNLSPWEVKHGTVMLAAVPELRTLRMNLCPQHLNDYTFWRIYFLLIKNQLSIAQQRIDKISQRHEAKKAKEQQSKKRSSSNSMDEILDALRGSTPFSSPSVADSLEEQYENLWREDILNSSSSFEADEGIDPSLDNYFSPNISNSSIDLTSSLSSEHNTNSSSISKFSLLKLFSPLSTPSTPNTSSTSTATTPRQPSTPRSASNAAASTPLSASNAAASTPLSAATQSASTLVPPSTPLSSKPVSSQAETVPVPVPATEPATSASDKLVEQSTSAEAETRDTTAKDPTADVTASTEQSAKDKDD